MFFKLILKNMYYLKCAHVKTTNYYMNTNHKNNFYKYLYKMNQITEYIAEINTRDYKNQLVFFRYDTYK